ncbi:inositol-pentakisphosphate 2-kinase [Diplocarpon rosae]|nr:inositol-pentakisphosphate 2-kinase [Diplocarpon rosae]
MDSPCIPSLPENTIIQYIAEGAANIVYRVIAAAPPNADPQVSELEQYGEGTPPPTELDTDQRTSGDFSFIENKLLRLRKNLATTVPCAVAQEAWTRLIFPLFSSHQLVMQSLVEVRTGNIVSRLNQSLEQWEHSTALMKGLDQSGSARPLKRRGVYLADDDHGLLVTNMSPGSHLSDRLISGLSGEEIVQFKPKWLAQSPSAPAAAKRCRTCANVARKNAAAARLHQPLETAFCPLDLLSPNYTDIYACAKAILHPESLAANIERFARWIQSTPLLKRLRDCQLAMDQRGTIDPDLSNEKLLVAMTLRDCTIFVKFLAEVNQGEDIEARMGDLDVKSPQKAAYWKETESPLIAEGWYTGLESSDCRQPLTCSLSRRSQGDQ